jgi:hypothetical protein
MPEIYQSCHFCAISKCPQMIRKNLPKDKTVFGQGQNPISTIGECHGQATADSCRQLLADHVRK